MRNPKLLVQALQGTRAQILWAFFFAGCAMDVDELREWTGRDRKTHYGACDALCGAGLLVKQTLAHGRVVYLLGPIMAPALRAWAAQLDLDVMELDSGIVAGELQESAFRTSGESVIVVDKSKLNVPSTTTITTIGQMSAFRTSGELAALKAALDEFKIVGRKRVALLECEWLTPDYVRASVQQAIDERNWDSPVGMAITRMLEHMEPVEIEPVKQKSSSYLQPCEDCGEVICVCEHADDCVCMQCRHDYPERFCQFKIIHPGEMLSRGNMRGDWSQVCDVPLKPGQKYCDRHQEEDEEE